MSDSPVVDPLKLARDLILRPSGLDDGRLDQVFGLFPVPDLLTGDRYDWRIGRNYVRLVPGERQAHVLRVE